ncbi:thiol reductant ABC exporter subunit CydC [Halomonas sp. MCCC 1A17488]|uniref:thiol reductant ABC exporter subunit CydC n=1 Tax=unclassified Halomonas TaxID=2609666 RepID=UPI0018D21BCF|nr:MULTISPECIES: thiol reductant ABC exporter subunit CydC [unclassified Halomonas]MCE8015294.1 thiol reductant ABC exporter subunit CydC [Halomonas sp. MCCC 1A17488]MCG3238627.1 thiol reductant ABC exporter subunit CydC [Halomonas sp. MCCC 1A17488]QPP51397.1 thiol reductant ABC exporter subunit CydC [Halomonas sp. SS10-MC5]
MSESLKATLSPWLRLLARRPRRLAIGVLLLAATLFSAVGLLALSGWFIAASALTGIALSMGLAASLDVYVPGGGIRFFAVSRTVARYLERLYNHDTVLRLLADLRVRLFAAMARLDDRSLARQRASDWLNRLTADIDTLDSLYLRLLAPPLVALAAVLLLAAFLALWVPPVGVALLALLLPAWAWLTVGQAWLGMAASRRQVGHLQRLRSQAIEYLTGLAELEAYGSRAWHRRGLRQREQALCRDQRRVGRVAGFGIALGNLAVGLGMVAALWLAALAWQRGAISGAVMVMMPLAVLAIGEALALLPAPFTQLGATRGAAERLNAVERASVGGYEKGDASLPGGPLAVRLEDVGLHYPGALTPALREIQLELRPGERLALTGASGAGKSSVAALLTRRLPPDHGSILLGGVPLAQVAERDLRERVAMLGQRIDLLQDSLATNLRLAAPDADDDRLWQALAWVELQEWAASLPHGLATAVGEGGRALSGGQARRLALARLWLRDPGLVILDEPFTGLDAATVARLSRRMDEWLRGRSVLYLVHQLDGGAFDPPGITLVGHLEQGRLTVCAKPGYPSG